MHSWRVNQSGLKNYVLHLLEGAYEKDWPIYPHAFEETHREASICYSEKNVQHMVIVLLLSGELVYQCEDSHEFHLKPGCMLIIPIGSNYSFRTTESKSYSKLALEARGTLLRATCEALGLARPLLLSLSSDDAALFEKQARELDGLMLSACESSVPEALSKFYAILLRLSILANATQNGCGFPLSRAKAILDNSTHDESGISNAARELGYCRASFNRLFKRESGLSPLQYSIQRKMERAKHLLSCSDLPVKEISTHLGYANQLYFSAAFRKHCGFSPRAFRREISKRTT